MSNDTTNLPYAFQWSTTHAHIAWADIHNNGLLGEIAVVAIDPKNGDLYFIPITTLDSIDRERLLRVISKRDAQKYPLWDLLDSTTLKNGLNALEYFNQLVRVRSMSGQIFAPNNGLIGANGRLSVKPNLNVSPAVGVQNLVQAPIKQVNTGVEQVRRGPGRPPAKR